MTFTIPATLSALPSINKVRNVSYETVQCAHPECRSNLVLETTHWICTKRRGIISEIIGLLRNLRVYFFKPLTQSVTHTEQRHFIHTVAQALKSILNSSYGILGFENFQYYYLSAAETLTAWGRHHITTTRGKSIELGLTPVIIDTDSLYLPVGDVDLKQRLTKWCEENTGIEMDAGSHFKYAVASGLEHNLR